MKMAYKVRKSAHYTFDLLRLTQAIQSCLLAIGKHAFNPSKSSNFGQSEHGLINFVKDSI